MSKAKVEIHPAAGGAGHARQHVITAPLDHTSGATPGQVLQADANGLPIDATNTDVQVAAAVAAAALAHARQHDIIDPLDHTSGATPGQVLQADANGLPIDATNTDAEVAAAIGVSHARQHALTSTFDHTSAVAAGKVLVANANGLPIAATNVVDYLQVIARAGAKNCWVQNAAPVAIAVGDLWVQTP